MPRALIVSPHLDDAAFSCAEPMLLLGRSGWRVDVATVFTATVASPTGFALTRQLDEGLGAEVDYMALRRAEDRDFSGRLDVACHHLDLPEAPHRGYDDPAVLFGEPRGDDPAPASAERALRELLDELRPDVCLAPLGVGGHVDHRVVVASLERVLPGPAPAAVLRYADQPYALRRPHETARAVSALGDAATVRFASDRATRSEALEAIGAYATRLGFQFGGESRMRAALDAATADGTRFWHRGVWRHELDPFLCFRPRLDRAR